jgi:hypothetical protein
MLNLVLYYLLGVITFALSTCGHICPKSSAGFGMFMATVASNNAPDAKMHMLTIMIMNIKIKAKLFKVTLARSE